jgi:hypothetical protein
VVTNPNTPECTVLLKNAEKSFFGFGSRLSFTRNRASGNCIFGGYVLGRFQKNGNLLNKTLEATMTAQQRIVHTTVKNVLTHSPGFLLNPGG